MRGMFLGLAACVLGLMVAGQSNAAGVVRKTVVAHGGHRGTVRSTTIIKGGRGPAYRGAYYRTHGMKFSGGYYFAGKNHHHWARRVWVPSANCYHYWDADLGCYFYYDTVRLGYYPVAGGGVIIR